MSDLNATDGYIVHGWMVTELGLRGPELTTFAIVHQFSQSKAGIYKGGVPYIMAWVGCSDVSARKYLHSLEKKGLIRSVPGAVNGVPFRDYQILDNHIPKILGDTPKILGDTPKILGDTPSQILDNHTPKILGDTPKILGDTPKILGVDNNRKKNKDFFLVKEKIVSNFFFQNWRDPNGEFDKLVAYNSGPAVKKKWDAMSDKEREAVAKLWRQEPQQRPRFDNAFLSYWRDVYLKLYGMDAPVQIRLAALDDKLRYNVRDGKLALTIAAELRDYLEQHAESFRPIFVRLQKEKGCTKLTYNILTLSAPDKAGAR